MSGSTRHYCAEDGQNWPCPDVTDYAQEDIRYLLAKLRKAHEALERVEALAHRWETVPALRKGTAAADLRAAVAAAKGDGRG